MMRLPPRTAILQSFARRENLGDVSGKANSQEVLASLLGMALGILIATAVGDSFLISSVTFGVASVVVGAATYLSLARLALKTLNWPRTELLVDAFVGRGVTPAPPDVNALERFATPPWLPRLLAASASVARLGRLLTGSAGRVEGPTLGPASKMPVVFGARLDAIAPTLRQLQALRRLYREEKYMLAVEMPTEKTYACGEGASSAVGEPEASLTSLRPAVFDDSAALTPLLLGMWTGDGGSVPGLDPRSASIALLDLVPAPPADLGCGLPGITPGPRSGRKILIAVSEGYGTRDALQSLLQAAWLQDRLRSEPGSSLASVGRLVISSLRFARRAVNPFVAALCAAGWSTEVVLFKPDNEVRNLHFLWLVGTV